jgi:hypothetical protein
MLTQWGGVLICGHPGTALPLVPIWRRGPSPKVLARKSKSAHYVLTIRFGVRLAPSLLPHANSALLAAITLVPSSHNTINQRTSHGPAVYALHTHASPRRYGSLSEKR